LTTTYGFVKDRGWDVLHLAPFDYDYLSISIMPWYLNSMQLGISILNRYFNIIST